MNRFKSLLVIATFTAISVTNAYAADATAPLAATPYARVLIPLHVENVAGAFGSIWSSDLGAFNDSDRLALFLPQEGACSVIVILCPPSTPPWGSISPRIPTRVRPITKPGRNPALLMYTEPQSVPALRFNLRISDVSQQAGSAGTQIPVIREAEAFTSNLQLINVRLGARFRNTLRIYDIDATPGAAVQVQIIDPFNNILSRHDLSFDVSEATIDPALDLPARPGYIELPIEPQLPSKFPAPSNELRVQIEPRSPGLRFWAFVSTTDNVTQQVTIVTPN